MEFYDVLIAGAGHGGAQAAISLRKNKFIGSIGVIDAGFEHPYERPPLSKDYLAGKKEFGRLQIRPRDFWAKNDIDLHLGLQVVRLGGGEKSVVLDDGREVSFGQLIWAAGGKARNLAGPSALSDGVHVLRDKQDADAIRKALDARTERVVIIGGGYIGLEAAAVLSTMGLRVTVVEAFDRVLSRVAGPEISEFFQTLHRFHGAEIILEATVDGLRVEDGKAVGVMLADGRHLPCDVVLVGIGIIPNVEPLIAAGAKGGNGVLVDAYCRTSLEHVYAIGDCAAHASTFANDAVVRVESVQNAADMAETAAKSICGEDVPYSATPWFWSHQYDVKLQTVGLSVGYDEAVVRGRPEDAKFSVVYLRQGRVVALDCVNNMKDFVQGRKLVEAAMKIDAAAIQNIEIPIKEIVGW